MVSFCVGIIESFKCAPRCAGIIVIVLLRCVRITVHHQDVKADPGFPLDFHERHQVSFRSSGPNAESQGLLVLHLCNEIVRL